jgi:low affinity Fe/Cu permease
MKAESEAMKTMRLEEGVAMSRTVYMVIFFVLMIACIAVPDVLFLSKNFTARLIWNIAVVVVFAVVYFVFLHNM